MGTPPAPSLLFSSAMMEMPEIFLLQNVPFNLLIYLFINCYATPSLIFCKLG